MRRFLTFSLPLLATVACVGADGPKGDDGAPGEVGPTGEDGQPGTDGTNGEDGAPGEDGADGSAAATGTLAPGEHLSLEHGLGDGAKVYQAQFQWGGVTYDHSAYPTLLPGHLESGWSLDDPNMSSFYGNIAGDRLTSGELAVYQRGYLDSDQDGIVGYLLDSSGAFQAPLPSYLDSSSQYFYEIDLAATQDGGFVVTVEQEALVDDSWREVAQIDRYDSTGILLGSEPLAPSGVEIYEVAVDALPTGGFVVGFTGYDDDLGETVGGLRFTDSSGSVASVTLSQLDSSYLRLAALPDGGAVVVVERELASDEPDGIDALFVSPDGTIDAEVRLVDSYLTDDCAVVVGSQDTVLIAAESGGPDLPFYAVLGIDGSVIQEATGMSGWENTMIEAGAFPDGDFLVIVTEDDSLAPMTWAIGAQGHLLRPMVVGDIASVPDYDLGVFLPTGSDHTLGHIDPSYDSEVAPHYTAYTKGVLQLREESSGEVRLYNHTPTTLDVTLVAHSAP